MEPGSLLPCSQQPFSDPCLDPHKFSLCQCISLWSILILFSHIYLNPRSDMLLSSFPTNMLYAFLFSTSCSATLPIYLPWLGYPNFIWQRVKIRKLFSNFLSLRLFSAQTFSSAPCSQTSSAYVPAMISEFVTHTEPEPNYSCIFLFLCFRQQTIRNNIWGWIVASITRIKSLINLSW
jgi:hypothetical protein